MWWETLSEECIKIKFWIPRPCFNFRLSRYGIPMIKIRRWRPSYLYQGIPYLERQNLNTWTAPVAVHFLVQPISVLVAARSDRMHTQIISEVLCYSSPIIWLHHVDIQIFPPYYASDECDIFAIVFIVFIVRYWLRWLWSNSLNLKVYADICTCFRQRYVFHHVFKFVLESFETHKTNITTISGLDQIKLNNWSVFRDVLYCDQSLDSNNNHFEICQPQQKWYSGNKVQWQWVYRPLATRFAAYPGCRWAHLTKRSAFYVD